MSAERKPSEGEPEAAEGEHEAADVTPESGGAQPPGMAARESGDAALAEVQAKADENWNLYVRAAAELDNVRKRAARDVENAHKFALENFGRELLGVVDSLEMGLAADHADAQSLREGSEATCKLLKGTLERFGIAEIDPEGEPFDPELHEAISMMPSPNVEPGSVAQVIQKGYALNGRLLRPARVIVASEAPTGEND